MIPKKNLFSGDLGKTKRIGGSPFMTIPHTRIWDTPSYDLGVYIPGEFVCSSMNGRLWIYKHLTSEGVGMYTVYALRWNETTGRMEFPLEDATKSYRLPLSGEMLSGRYPMYPIARGLDWILFTFVIIQVTDAPPYIVFNLVTQLSEPIPIDPLTDMGFLYSPHRSVKYRPADEGVINGVHVGCGVDPFTHNTYGFDGPASGVGNSGYFSSHLGGMGLYPYGTRQMEPCYATLPSIGDWIVVEDFLVRRPSSPLPTNQNKHHYFMRQIRPLIPLELNWYSEQYGGMSVFPTHGTGYSATRRGIQLSYKDDGLYGRGLMHMGRVRIIPATFSEDGEAVEFYLLITNSNNCIGPYNLAVDQALDENHPWMSVGAAELADAAGLPDRQLVGVVNETDSPLFNSLCRRAKEGQILLPDDPLGGHHGTWVEPRADDICSVVVDPTSHLGLALGRKGVTYLKGDTVNNQVVIGEDYRCIGLSRWMSPAGCLETLSQDATMDTDAGGSTVTNLFNYFDRIRMPRRLLPMAHGIFEKKDPDTGEVLDRVRLSFGEKRGMADPGDGILQEMSLITVNELSVPENLTAPPDRVPWDNVYTNPFNVQLLRSEHDNAVSAQYRTGWFRRSQANSGREEYVPPCIPMLYESVDGGQVAFAYVNPDTAELNPASYNFGDVELSMFPVQNDLGAIGALDTNGDFIPMNLALPDWLNGPDDWRLVDAYDGLPGEDPDRVPALRVESRFYYYPSDQPGPGSYPFPNQPPEVVIIFGGSAHDYPVCFLEETSSRVRLAWRHSGFGARLPGGGAAQWNYTGMMHEMLQAPNRILHEPHLWNPYSGYHYVKDPVTNYRGKRKYRKTLVLWGARSQDYRPIGAKYPIYAGDHLGAWDHNHLLCIRADLDDAVFSFDEELKRSKIFLPSQP